MNTDTPETNANAGHICYVGEFASPTNIGEFVRSDFARKLERERDEAWQAARERQWMPIETAPKDKIEILAWSNRHGVNVGILTHYKRPEMPSRKGGWFLPTHWMPLPNPPASEKI